MIPESPPEKCSVYPKSAKRPEMLIWNTWRKEHGEITHQNQ